ncbi:hypothetical protein VTH82DRAFT_2136 [Thermothelomyces myriococcoides]
MKDPNPTKKRRYAITKLQRKRIRQYVRENPLLRQHEIAAWASREFGHRVSQSTICESLKPTSTEEDDGVPEQQKAKDISLVDALNGIDKVIDFLERREHVNLAELEVLRRMQERLVTKLIQAHDAQLQRKHDSHFECTTTSKSEQN